MTTTGPRSNRRIISISVVVAALLLVLGACGDDPTRTATGTESDPEATSEGSATLCEPQLTALLDSLKGDIADDYEPSESPNQLANDFSDYVVRSDAVTSITVDGDGRATMTLTDLAVLPVHETDLADEVTVEWWASPDSGTPDPSIYDRISVIAFLDEHDGVYRAPVEGLYIGCGDNGTARALIADPIGPGWPTGSDLTLATLTTAVLDPASLDGQPNGEQPDGTFVMGPLTCYQDLFEDSTSLFDAETPGADSPEEAVELWWTRDDGRFRGDRDVLTESMSGDQVLYDDDQGNTQLVLGLIELPAGGWAIESTMACADSAPTTTSSEPTTNPPSDSGAETGSVCVPGPVPANAGLDPFYSQGCQVNGFWVVANEVVDPEAITRSAETVAAIFATDNRLAPTLTEFDIRLGIIGRDQRTTEMPEYRDLNEVFPETDWDSRARGLGATFERPLVSAGEENVLCLADDRYLGEDILLHEFAHVLHEFGYRTLDSDFDADLVAAYDQAIANGTWDNTYAAPTQPNTGPKAYRVSWAATSRPTRPTASTAQSTPPPNSKRPTQRCSHSSKLGSATSTCRRSVDDRTQRLTELTEFSQPVTGQYCSERDHSACDRSNAPPPGDRCTRFPRARPTAPPRPGVLGALLPAVGERDANPGSDSRPETTGRVLPERPRTAHRASHDPRPGHRLPDDGDHRGVGRARNPSPPAVHPDRTALRQPRRPVDRPRVHP